MMDDLNKIRSEISSNILATIESLVQFVKYLTSEKLTKVDLEEFHQNLLENQYIINAILEKYYGFDSKFLQEKIDDFWWFIDKIYERNAKKLNEEEIEKLEREDKCLVCGEEIEFDDYGVAKCNNCKTYYYVFFYEDGSISEAYMKND